MIGQLRLDMVAITLVRDLYYCKLFERELMKTRLETHSRRQFLGTVVRACFGTLTLGFIVADTAALAAPAKVSENGTFAKELHYVKNASREKPVGYESGEKCANCVFYQGKEGHQYGPCKIFGGKLVNANGWCTAYRAKS